MEEKSVDKEICLQKHQMLEKESKEFQATLKEHDLKIQASDVRLVELSGDVKHIKDRIDNGLSKTIYEIRQKMDEFVPLVRESSEWAGRFKQAIFYVAVIGVCGGLVSLAFYLARSFVK